MFNISFTGFPLFSTRGSTSVTQVCQPARSGAGLRIRPKQLANQRREGHVDGGIKVHSLRACVISQHLRSEEHTSELQSLAYLVCRLLLEKKKKTEQNAILCNQRDV